jgi:hypothetical protein
MTKTYDNTNKFAVFTNDRKTEQTHADFNGTLNVDGKEYWINMWANDGNGPAFRGSVKPKNAKPVSNAEGRRRDAQAPSGATSFAEDLDDKIPFSWVIALLVPLLSVIGVA